MYIIYWLSILILGYSLFLFVSLSKELEKEELQNSVKEAARIAVIILAVIAYMFSHVSSRAINWNKKQEKIQNVSDRGF
jgi:hypothetical protein